MPDVALVYAPGVGDDVAGAVVDHCERLRFRFAVIDAARSVTDDSALQPRDRIADTTRAAFYHPWLVVADPESGERLLVPPGGHVLGVYARTDNTRGVHKAPANEIVRNCLGLGVKRPDTSLGLLVSDFQRSFQTRPWLFWFPGLFIIVIALSINFIGDGLRDAFDPRQTRVRA